MAINAKDVYVAEMRRNVENWRMDKILIPYPRS